MQKRTWNKKYTNKKTSSELIDEKIAFLDREMRKTKLGEAIANNTSGLYQQGDSTTTPPVFDEWNNTFPDSPEGPTIPGVGGAKLSGSGSFTSDDFTAIRREYPQYTKNNGVFPYTSTGYWSWVWVSVNFGAEWGNRTNSFGEVYGTTGARIISGYYTSLSAIDTRLIAGGSIVRVSDPDVGYTTFYWPNNYPATIPVSGARGIDDPNFFPIISRERGNVRGTDPWKKLRDMFDAGKGWMDRMFGERLKKKQNEVKDLLKGLFDKSLKGLDGMVELGNEQIEKFIGDSFDKSIGGLSALQTLSAFWDHQEGRDSYTKDSPYVIPYGQTQKQNIANALDDALNYTDNMGFDLRGKIDRGENLTQQEIDFLNQKMNYQFGSVTPEGFGYYRTFGKFSPEVKITKNNEGGYNIKDNYVFDNLNDFEGGEIEIGNVKITPATKGEYYAKKDKGDIDFYDKEPNAPGAKKIGSLKQMYITTSLPSVSKVKEQVNLEDLQKQLIMDEMDYGILIKKLSKLQEDQKSFDKTRKSLKRVKCIVGE